MARRNTRSVEQRYTTDQVAGLLAVSPRTVIRYRDSGELAPWERLAGKCVYPASTVNRFLESRRIGAAA